MGEDQAVFALGDSRWMCGTCGALWDKSKEPWHHSWCWSPEALEALLNARKEPS